MRICFVINKVIEFTDHRKPLRIKRGAAYDSLAVSGSDGKEIVILRCVEIVLISKGIVVGTIGYLVGTFGIKEYVVVSVKHSVSFPPDKNGEFGKIIRSSGAVRLRKHAASVTEQPDLARVCHGRIQPRFSKGIER